MSITWPGLRPGARLSDLLSSAIAIGGYAFCIVLVVVGFRTGQWTFPGGDVVDFYAGAGTALREGATSICRGFSTDPRGSWRSRRSRWLGPGDRRHHPRPRRRRPVDIAWGNWRRLGYILWIPLIPYECSAGQLNLLVAAAIVAAQHGIVWPLAAMTLAKVWPAIALPLRHWRRFLIVLAAFALISLPWLHLWPEWIATLVDTSATRARTRRARSVGRARGSRRAAAHPPATVGAGPRGRHLQSRPLLGPARGAGGALSLWLARKDLPR